MLTLPELSILIRSVVFVVRPKEFAAARKMPFGGAAEPVTFTLAPLMLPPTNRFPAIPAPPRLIIDPVAVLVLCVVLVMAKLPCHALAAVKILPLTPTPPATNNAPVVLDVDVVVFVMDRLLIHEELRTNKLPLISRVCVGELLLMPTNPAALILILSVPNVLFTDPMSCPVDPVLKVIAVGIAVVPDHVPSDTPVMLAAYRRLAAVNVVELSACPPNRK